MATFDFDVAVLPEFIDFLNIGAGYGVLSVPVDGLLSGDVVNSATITIAPTNGIGSTISKTVDMVQRTQGFFEWVTGSEISAHFTLAAADVNTIAAGSYEYSVSVTITRNGVPEAREVQSGNIQARTSNAGVALIVSTITVAPSSASGNSGQNQQLTATAYDGNGNVIAGQVFTWTSSNPLVATVSATGLVSFLVPGTTTIMASAQGIEGEATGTCTDPNYAGATNKQVAGYLTSDLSWRPRSLDFTWIAGVNTVPQGGTGVASVTTGRLLLGAGAAAMTELAPGAAGLVVRSNGSSWTAGAILTADVSDLASAATGITKVGTINTGAWQGTSIGTGFTDAKVVAIGGTANRVTIGGTATNPTVDISAAYVGQATLTTLGTITTGTWNGTAIVDAFLASLDASKLTGTVATGRIAGSYTGITAVGTLTSLTVSGSSALAGDVAVNTNKFTVAASSGNTVVAGTLAVTGAVTLTTPLTDSNLAQLATAGKVANSATTATNANTASAIVARDGSGNFTAGTITANLVGSVTGSITGSAATLSPGRNINGVLFDGSVNITVTADASTLTGTTLNATVVTSSLTSVGNLTSLTVNGGAYVQNLTVEGSSANLVNVYPTGAASSPSFRVDTSIPSAATGIKITAMVAGNGVALRAISSAANEGLKIDALGSGVISLGTVSTGAIALARDTNITGALTTSSTINGQTVSSSASFTGTVTAATGLTVSAGGITVTGASTITGTLGGLTGVTLASGTYTGNLASTLTFGAHLTSGGASFNNSANVTITSDATNANTASTIVARDGSGNFSAGTITAALTGNASTATALATGRTINGVTFDGTANITVTAAAGTLTGATLNATVTASSLTSVGNLTSLTVNGGAYMQNFTLEGTSANLVSVYPTGGAAAPTLRIDTTAVGAATGLRITPAAAGSGIALKAMSSAANEGITFDALGTGTVGIATVSTGAITLGTATTANSTLNVVGNFAVNTNKFNVTAASGNTSVAGTLTSTGDLSVNGTVIITAASGNTTIGGTLGVSGLTTLTGKAILVAELVGGSGSEVLRSATTATRAIVFQKSGSVQESWAMTPPSPSAAAAQFQLQVTPNLSTTAFATVLAINTAIAGTFGAVGQVVIGDTSPAAAAQISALELRPLSATYNVGLNVTGSWTPTGGTVWGIRVAPTLTATANNDTLYGFQATTTMADGGFTGVSMIDIAATRNSGGSSGTTTYPLTIRLRDTSNGGAWSTTANWANLDFYSDDPSGVGAGVRARIGARMSLNTGAQTGMVFSVAPGGGLTDSFYIAPAGDLAMMAAARFYLDGVTAAGDTYLTESSANVVILTTGGGNVLKVDGSVASVAAGIVITGAIAGGTVGVAVLSTVANASVTFDAKGSGTVGIATVSTGAVTIGSAASGITLGVATGVTGALTVTSTSASALTVGRQGATNPVLKVNANTATVVTGLSITGAASGAGVAIAAISSSAAENVTLDALGTGTFTINGTATGAITLGRATTITTGGLLISAGGLTISASGYTVTGNSTLTGTLAVTSTVQAGAVGAIALALSGAAASASSAVSLTKAVTAIVDAAITTVFTVSIPNAAHSATVRVILCGSLGAGGAIGANEASGVIAYDVIVTRTAGVNAVAAISAAYGSTTSLVAGGATITVAGTLGAMSGGVGATNTFTIRVTITRGSGASTNHTCLAYAQLANANASGVTIS